MLSVWRDFFIEHYQKLSNISTLYSMLKLLITLDLLLLKLSCFK